MLLLSISHNIYLSEEEAQNLLSGEVVHTTGISIPVWYFKGNTSEPAEEVFCQYTLQNQPEYNPIKTQKTGYSISLPQLPPDYVMPEIDIEDWLDFNEHERFKWYEAMKVPSHAEQLKPVSKGGNECIYFKEYNKIKRADKTSNLVHIIDIKYAKNLFKNNPQVKV